MVHLTAYRSGGHGDELDMHGEVLDGRIRSVSTLPGRQQAEGGGLDGPGGLMGHGGPDGTGGRDAQGDDSRVV